MGSARVGGAAVDGNWKRAGEGTRAGRGGACCPQHACRGSGGEWSGVAPAVLGTLAQTGRENTKTPPGWCRRRFRGVVRRGAAGAASTRWGQRVPPGCGGWSVLSSTRLPGSGGTGAGSRLRSSARLPVPGGRKRDRRRLVPTAVSWGGGGGARPGPRQRVGDNAFHLDAEGGACCPQHACRGSGGIGAGSRLRSSARLPALGGRKRNRRRLVPTAVSWGGGAGRGRGRVNALGTTRSTWMRRVERVVLNTHVGMGGTRGQRVSLHALLV